MYIREAQVSIYKYHESLPILVTKLGHYPILLGIL
jgi:hypothetical protein